MSRTREQILRELPRLKAEYGELFDSTALLLFHHDPVGINFETNPDEYEPEVATILPRLRGWKSEQEVRRVVYEEFVRWFGAGSGPEVRYARIATELWQLWCKSDIRQIML